ncbi:NAD(P)(+) transhydrogenase (Re/Si-specific) subunit beta [Sphingobacterium sp. SGR-19]|uniref:NAD(P)(+) transhydrogenase (Re/Si-specific) subunit beta n=1 Tax=Sphingobacterium sp. SGR-19 TaxID=2710886 RepID=UPI0013EA6283|nr:NAD(P)(+) transhydrogenase (Re/Si-specific) subunit beta [Sphingobacterium sp. SGR-19]NGM66712.1 NAD(P)(+) transhydrogenase (Re/Si-specific) subunit beta [Sphingobacterium sp. SGR-19]
MNIIIQLSYLIASVLFIVGIKMLGRTKTARKGNVVSSIGMFIAILATVVQVEAISLIDILICVLIGSTIGLIIAKKVEMTKIPEMVAIFNGFGGLASLSVALSDFWLNTQQRGLEVDNITGISVALSILIGGITFTGSLIAFMKLSGRISGRAIVFTGQHLINLVLLILSVGIVIFALTDFSNPNYMIILAVLSLVLGILVVIPIGGADMPVVISLLNSYSGMAACATGFVLNNNALIVTGALVGASGIILTQIMCKAMNRSLMNVLLGGFGQTSAAGGEVDGPQITVKEVGVEEAAQIFDSVSSLIIVPGYGMAVAHAQHIIRELSELCEKNGVNVRFAIHPVAGRMPGHMNVLLAEANISYDKLIEMDEINDDFANTDLVFVVGANDVVNPAAKTNPNSPIFGMPVLNVEKAQTVIVSKRSMGKGYAGIENELFGADNCLMLFGDAKQTITKLVGELKEQG